MTQKKTRQTVLVTGAQGQLGKDIVLSEYTVVRTDVIVPEKESQVIQLDIINEQDVKQVLNRESPDLILHLAAMTHVDRCEENPEIAGDVNVRGTEYLLKHFSGKFIFISTDYVFDGKEGPYDENDKVNPINHYGKTKLEAEKKVQELAQEWLIIRTNVVWNVGGFKASFVDWVVRELSEKKKIRVVNDQWNNPAWTVDLAKVIEKLIIQNATGMYHHGSSDVLNRYDFARKIAQIYELDERLIIPISTLELNQSAKRPLKSGLKTDKIEKDFGIIPSTIDSDLNNARLKNIT